MMVSVTVFRGRTFDSAEEISDFDFPAVPRVGETVSLYDYDFGADEKVTDVNYTKVDNSLRVRVLISPRAGGMQRIPLGGI